MRAWRDEDKTDWFPSHRKPVRSGVYEVVWTSKMLGGVVERGFAFYDAYTRRWGWTTTLFDRVDMRSSDGARQDKCWRGLRDGKLLARQEALGTAYQDQEVTS